MNKCEPFWCANLAELAKFAAKNQREHDLVRQQRAELFEAGLIDKEEYAALASEFGAVQRLEDYDAVRATAEQRGRAKGLREAATELNLALNRIDTGRGVDRLALADMVGLLLARAKEVERGS